MALASVDAKKGDDWSDDQEAEAFDALLWLADRLPEPFGGRVDQLYSNPAKYTVAIDDGKGIEVAAAIRSLKRNKT